LIVSDELDLDVAGEFPGLKVEGGNVQAKEEEDVVNTNRRLLETRLTLFEST